jgi:hypothetical protein
MTIITESGAAAALAVSGRFCTGGGTLTSAGAVASAADGVTGVTAWLPTVADDAASVTDVPVTTGVGGFGGGAAATSIGLTGGGIVGGGGGGVSEPLPAADAGAVIDGGVAVSSRGGDGLTLK